MEELDLSLDYIRSGSGLTPLSQAELLLGREVVEEVAREAAERRKVDMQIIEELALEAADRDDEGMFKEYARRYNEL